MNHKELLNWHRTLDKESLAFSIDFVEIRKDRGEVGFFCFEQTKDICKCLSSWKPFKANCLLALSDSTGIPSFLVFHLPDMKQVKVFSSNTNFEDGLILSEQGMKDFVNGL